jgi:hypothetical protein
LTAKKVSLSEYLKIRCDVHPSLFTPQIFTKRKILMEPNNNQDSDFLGADINAVDFAIA